jgi:type IV secretory pathway VirD2 relaxase
MPEQCGRTANGSRTSGIRNIAEDRCTRQPGYRAQLDAAEAERREIAEKRFTSIDPRLLESVQESDPSAGTPHFTLVQNTARKNEMSRLAVLQRMGLAESTGSNTWRLSCDPEQILRAMQRTSDRQRNLAAHGVLMSDEWLLIEMPDLRQVTSVEGEAVGAVAGDEEAFPQRGSGER